MPSSLSTRTWLKLRYYSQGLPWYAVAVRVLIDTLAKLGIRIEPYHLVLEGIDRCQLSPPAEQFAAYDCRFLDAPDMQRIAALPGRAVTEAELLHRLAEGKCCLGIQYQGEVVAFTWCDLHACMFETHPLFSLREDEAYLFDAHAIESFRGKGLAPYMRFRCYQELAKLGRTKCYSITVLWNTPAARFKEKLGATVLKLGVLVELFRQWRFHRWLKQYR